MEYKIANIALVTERPLPDEVQQYMASWASDPCWDIWDVPAYAEFEPELRAFDTAYSIQAQAKWEARKQNAGSLDAARDAFVRGEYDQAQASAAIAQAAALERIAAALEAYWS